MQSLKVGQSGLKLSKIIFGAWAIGKWEMGGVNPDGVISALKCAIDMGYTSIDTAPCYGLGLSERIVGKVMKSIARDKVQILTKCGVVTSAPDNHPPAYSQIYNGKRVKVFRYSGYASIINECENSLRRIKTDYIDVYSVHWPDIQTPFHETAEALYQLTKSGKVREIGLCNFSLDQVKIAKEFANIACLKIRHSMLNRLLNKDILEYCKSEDIKCLAYSVTQRGIISENVYPRFLWLSGDTQHETELYNNDKREQIDVFLKEIAPIANKMELSLSDLAINWTLSDLAIDGIFLGANSTEEVRKNILNERKRIKKTDLMIVEKALKKLEGLHELFFITLNNALLLFLMT